MCLFISKCVANSWSLPAVSTTTPSLLLPIAQTPAQAHCFWISETIDLKTLNPKLKKPTLSPKTENPTLNPKPMNTKNGNKKTREKQLLWTISGPCATFSIKMLRGQSPCITHKQYIYINMYVYIYMYIYMYIYVYIYVYVYICIYIYMYMYIYICIYIYCWFSR